MNDLAEFLLARITEDERRVDTIPDWHSTGSARGDGWGNRGSYCPLCDHYMFDGTEAVTEEAWWGHMESVHRRTRVLAECEAKRRIIEWHENWPVLVEKQPVLEHDQLDDPSALVMRMTKEIAWLTDREYRTRFGSEPPSGPILRLLALPYADHPDYRDEWRPTA